MQHYEGLINSTTEMALGLLALGLDPDKAVLFRQSDRLEHIELMWLFASVTPMGWAVMAQVIPVIPVTSMVNRASR